jgi:hypothetical protein
VASADELAMTVVMAQTGDGTTWAGGGVGDRYPPGPLEG